MKGLFLICTLLSLVGFTNSLSAKERLAEVKEKQQQVKKNLEKTKNKRSLIIGTASFLMNNYEDTVDLWMAQIKNEEFHEGLLPLEAALKKTKDFMVETRSSINKANDELGKQIEQTENEWKQTENLIKFYEEQQAKCPVWS